MAEELWDSIINFSWNLAFVEGEGNSGEFSDAEELEKIREDLDRSEKSLIEKFAQATGWRPTLYNDGKYDQIWILEWDLSLNKNDKTL